MDTKLVPRDRVCAMEVWVECFSGHPRQMQKRDAIEINAILSSIGGWKRTSSKIRCGSYGIQNGFIKSIVET